jgi:hypothetical protein
MLTNKMIPLTTVSKNILLLNHADSMVDKYTVIGRKEIFEIAKAEYNISDDERTYEAYKEKYKTANGIDIQQVVNDMLRIQRSAAPPREEPPPQTLTSPSCLSKSKQSEAAQS